MASYDLPVTAFSLNLLGVLHYYMLNHYALQGFHDLIARTPSNWRILSEAHCFLAFAYLGLVQLDEALVAAQQALAYARKTQNPRDLAQAWLVLGQIAAEMDRPISVSQATETLYKAPACFRKSLTRFTDLNLLQNQAFVLWAWADYALHQGQPEEAEKMWQAAREILVSLDLPLWIDKMDRQKAIFFRS